MNFQGKTVVVTGGASGIGRACAIEFAARQAAVALVDRNATAGEEVAKEIRREGGSAKFFSANLSISSRVEELVGEIVAEFEGIDALVNNAGIQRYGTVTTTSEKEWQEVMGANLNSAFLASKYAIPEMIKRGGGSIIITGSTQSIAAHHNSVTYVVSKHALVGLTKCIALDFAKQHIRANCVLPGAIDTPMIRQSAALDPNPEKVIEACHKLQLLGRMGKPEEVARVIAFLTSDLASFVTGCAMLVDGGQMVPIGGTGFQEIGTGSTSL